MLERPKYQLVRHLVMLVLLENIKARTALFFVSLASWGNINPTHFQCLATIAKRDSTTLKLIKVLAQIVKQEKKVRRLV